jgi:hypothetical protein
MKHDVIEAAIDALVEAKKDMYQVLDPDGNVIATKPHTRKRRPTHAVVGIWDQDNAQREYDQTAKTMADYLEKGAWTQAEVDKSLQHAKETLDRKKSLKGQWYELSVNGSLPLAQASAKEYRDIGRWTDITVTELVQLPADES